MFKAGDRVRYRQPAVKTYWTERAQRASTLRLIGIVRSSNEVYFNDDTDGPHNIPVTETYLEYAESVNQIKSWSLTYGKRNK